MSFSWDLPWAESPTRRRSWADSSTVASDRRPSGALSQSGRPKSAAAAEPWCDDPALDVVLVDLFLGNASGLDLLERLKAIRTNVECNVDDDAFKQTDGWVAVVAGVLLPPT